MAAEGGEIAAALVDEPATEPLGPFVAASERCRPNAGEYALLVESILEGYLVHYRRPRLIASPDEDLRLLAGDYLYALGLSRLAALGDLAAVRVLADVIALSAKAHAGPDAATDEIVEAIWALGAIGVAGGPWLQGEAAAKLLREGVSGGPAAALEAASRRAVELGIAEEAQRALIALSTQVLSDSRRT